MFTALKSITPAYYSFIFDLGYRWLQDHPDDREVLAVTFEHGRRALWGLDKIGREDKDLADKVYDLSKQIKAKVITWEDAPYMFPERQNPPEF